MVNAHSAKADTQATHDVLMAQLDRYEELKGDVDSLNVFTTEKNLQILQDLLFIIEMGKVFLLENTKVKLLKVYLRTNPLLWLVIKR